MRSARPSLALIVPATNAPPTLERCLEPLRRGEAELIVATDPPGGSPAAARNEGAGRASAEVLVFVDADVVVHADAIDRLRDAFAADPTLTAVFGAYDDRPPASGTVSRFRNLLHHHVHSSSPGPAQTFWAGIGAVRRDAFLDAGGFDARRFRTAAVEDIDLGRRLRARGGRIVLDPAIRGTHLKRWSLAEMVRTDLVRRAIPWTRIQLEERELSSELNVGARHRLATVLALGAALAAAGGRARLAGGAAAGTVALDLPFMRLLARREGLGGVVLGTPLLLVHRLVGAVGFGLGALAHAGAGFPRSRAGEPGETAVDGA